jgi:hypothetical protein
MNAHRSFGFLAALLLTVGQILVVSAGTATVANNTSERSGYEITLNG